MRSASQHPPSWMEMSDKFIAVGLLWATVLAAGACGTDGGQGGAADAGADLGAIASGCASDDDCAALDDGNARNGVLACATDLGICHVKAARRSARRSRRRWGPGR